MTVADLLAAGRRLFADSRFDISRREAHLLLGHVLGLSEARLLARDDEAVSPQNADRALDLFRRRAAGEPAAYLLGVREFYGREFSVDPRVLVPRPETEHLVEAALGLDLPPTARVLDVGVGSGAIAVTLGLERPGWRITATDVSPGALAVARRNAHRLGARIALVGCDLTTALDLATFDLVVANLPYLAPEERHEISREVLDHEPSLALFAPAAGLGLVARLLDEASSLQSETPVILEIGHRQAPEVEHLIRSTPWRLERTIRDYQGIARTLILSRTERKERH